MATGEIPTMMEQDFRHTCSLCMEPYRGRSPKILPCFHTFCLPCLIALQHSVETATSEKRRPGDENQPATTDRQKQESESSQDKQVETDTERKADKADVTKDGDDVTSGRDDGDGAMFLCPTCRTPVTIPGGGVTALQTNFYLDDEANPEEAPPPAVCEMCEEGNQQDAAHVCQQCQLRMCRACRRHHDRFNRDHHVTSVSLSQPEVKSSKKKGLCLVHRDQVLRFQCRQCDVSICLHCKRASHEGHVTTDLGSATLKAKEEVTSLVNSAQQQLEVVESSVRHVERDERQLTRDVQKMTEHVNARYDVLVTLATQSRDQMLEKVKAIEDSARIQLRTEKTAATVAMETLSNLVSRAARVTGNHSDVVLRNELRAALLSEDRLDRHRQQADRPEAFCGWSYDVTEASLLQQDEVRAYTGRVMEGGTDDVSRPPSLRELTDRVDRLVTHVTQTNTDMMSQLTACKDDVSSLKKTESDLQRKTTSLTDDVATMKKTEAELQSKTTSLTDEVATMKKAEADLHRKTTSLADNVATLKKTETDFQRQVTSLNEEVATMKKTESDLQRKTTSIIDDVIELKKIKTYLQSKTTSLDTSVNDVLKKTTTLVDDVTLLKKREAEMTKVNTVLEEKIGKAGRMVSFCVTGLDWSRTKQDKPLVFSNVKVNEGHCYDDTTGVFTAPVPGTYVFTAAVESRQTDRGVMANIQVDGVYYAYVRASCTSMGSNSVSVQLQAGQRVWVEAWSTPNDYLTGSYLPCFTGSLVQPQV